MATKNKQVEELSISKLLLDESNPRFGSFLNSETSQADILDHIVEKFGVEDVISSLAVNGYFSAEPLVCKRISGSDLFVVVEGNRRLASCLILLGDDRAKRQSKRTAIYQEQWKSHGKKKIDPVPVIIFDEGETGKDLLSYLGVRHIASSQPWDSYAKAAWVAKVIEENQFSVKDVSQMIGDQHKTVSRLLEGYYFVQQLEKHGLFYPQDSIRRGRGSVSEYPFSWVYTILGYRNVRDFLGMVNSEPKEDLLKEKSLAKGSFLIKTMFGDKSKGRSAAVEDSRELSGLASAVSDDEQVALLEQGKTLAEIHVLVQPLEERMKRGLIEARTIHKDLITRLAEQDLPQEIAMTLLESSQKNRKGAIELDKKIQKAALGQDDE